MCFLAQPLFRGEYGRKNSFTGARCCTDRACDRRSGFARFEECGGDDMSRAEMLSLLLVVVVASLIVRFLVSNPAVGVATNKISTKLFA